MHVLITGAAGFIGYHLCRKLSAEGTDVYGIDSLNHYYDVRLKLARLGECGIRLPSYGKECVSDRLPGYRFRQTDLCDRDALETLFRDNRFDCVVNLAAQAGVRYSLTHPESYVESNISGFLNLLETCRTQACKRLIYASSSSVYGNSPCVPFKESDRVERPESIYAATKRTDELMAYTYSRLYGMQTIGLRFFTVYGPFGRPDMAPFLFADAILNNRPIRIFNHGDLSRDFTYVGDTVEGVARIIGRPAPVREDTPGVPAVIYNIGHGSPVRLMDFIETLEHALGRTAQKTYTGMQPGDVRRTWADTTKLNEDYGYTPSTPLEEGVRLFADWFKTFQF